MFRLPIRSPFDRDSLSIALRLLQRVYDGPPDTFMLNGRPMPVNQSAGWTPVGSMARGLQSAGSLGARLRGAPRGNADLVRINKGPSVRQKAALTPMQTQRTMGDIAEEVMRRRAVKKALAPVRQRPDAGKPHGG